MVRPAPAAAGLLPSGRRSRSRRPRRWPSSPTLTGEFEKPRFFNYKASLCAHSRSRKIQGCTQCIDVCSALAIRPDGDRIAVEPHLCVGCGACTTVCPSGALTYAYPAVPDLAARIKTLLSTYANGGRARRVPPVPRRGRPRGDRASRRGAATGLPARVIPLEIHHIASVGLDVWLAALAWGASQVAVLATGSEAPQYREALAFQMRSPTRSPTRWATRASTSGSSTPTRSTRSAQWQPALGPRVAADVRGHRREAHDRRAWRSSISPRTRRRRGT